MSLSLYNTLTRRKEVFEPLDPEHVRMYVCGPTVYDYAHVGNARPVVVFDVLYRLLKWHHRDAKVTYVRNITDVDDKIIAAARELNEPIESLTLRYSEAYLDDMRALGALAPDVQPRATLHIAEMIDLIGRLIDKGNAYAADGHVLFHVPSMADYGRLSGRDRDEQIAGARVEVAPYKRDPADFVLWKPAADGDPGWDSPWGRGRPGWHLECSAMSARHLGESFDIHGGGLDLIFPHHENEIAQSVCGFGTPTFARYWVHNGYVVVNGEKMSKSLGNYLTVHDLLEEFPGWGEAVRLVLLTGHYRQPLDFTRDKLREAKTQLDRLYGALRHAGDVEPASWDPAQPVIAALDDDLNTPRALAELHELAGALNKAVTAEERARLKGQLAGAGDVLGILQADPEAWLQGAADTASGPSSAEIESLITARADARKRRDFSEADRIRSELASQGVVLEDGPGGTSWRRAS